MTDTITITATVPADMAADVWQRIGVVVEAAGLDPGLVVCSIGDTPQSGRGDDNHDYARDVEAMTDWVVSECFGGDDD